jgi:hypothetical protein
MAVPALLGLTLLVVLGWIDARRAVPPSRMRRGRLRFRLGVAMHHLAQPLARSWGRRRHRTTARRDLEIPTTLAAPLTVPARGVSMVPADRPRTEMVSAIVAALRVRGMTVCTSTGWEEYDARLVGSFTVDGELVSSAFPEGAVQFRVDPVVRSVRVAALVAVAAALAVVVPFVGAIVLVALVADLVRGWWRTGPWTHRVIASLVRWPTR